MTDQTTPRWRGDIGPDVAPVFRYIPPKVERAWPHPTWVVVYRCCINPDHKLVRVANCFEHACGLARVAETFAATKPHIMVTHAPF